MSGTSYDGIDLCAILVSPKIQLLHFASFGYPTMLRKKIAKIIQQQKLSLNDYNDINYYNDNNYSNDNDNNYSNNIEYFYECSRCNARWDESKEPKCICLDESELISFNDHEIENIPINLDTNKTDTKYLDKLKKNIPINLDKLKEKLIDKN